MPRFIPFLTLPLAIVGTSVPKPVEPIRGGWQIAFVDATRGRRRARQSAGVSTTTSSSSASLDMPLIGVHALQVRRGFMRATFGH